MIECDRCKYPEPVQGCGCNRCPKCDRPGRVCIVHIFPAFSGGQPWIYTNPYINLIRVNENIEDWFIGESI